MSRLLDAALEPFNTLSVILFAQALCRAVLS